MSNTKQLYRSGVIACVLAWIIGTGGIAEASQSPSIEFSGFGNIRLNEGSLEIWMTPLDSLEAVEESLRWSPIYNILEFGTQDGFVCQLSLMQHKGRVRPFVRLRDLSGVEGLRDLGNQRKIDMDLMAGRPIHFAITWKEKRVRFYVNGDLLHENDQLMPLPGNPSLVSIVVGKKEENRYARAWAFQGMRISGIERESFPQVSESPKADIYTLLLDSAVGLEGEPLRTRPSVAAKVNNQATGGLVRGPITKIQINGTPALLMGDPDSVTVLLGP